MFIFLMCVLCWYLTGLIFSILGAIIIDETLTVGDLFQCIFFGILGPIVMLVFFKEVLADFGILDMEIYNNRKQEK